jgi:hypothetical protein
MTERFIAPDALAALRDRLHEMRGDLRDRLAGEDVFDAGLLRLLADVEVVLGALERDDER